MGTGHKVFGTEVGVQPAPMQHRRSLTVVVPALNEANGLARLLARLEPVLAETGLPWEIVFVDDGSTDATLEKLRAMHARDGRIKAVSLSRNFGKEIAIAAGLSYAQGDAVILMDADLQHPPELIRQFVALWQDGYDIVYGQRTDRAADSALRRMFSRAFYTAFHTLSGTQLPEGAGDFRL